MIYFVNKLEFNYIKYQYNGTIREGNYKANFLFPINDFVSFVTDNELILFALNIFYRKMLMESVCHNLNLLKFETKLLIHINNGPIRANIIICEVTSLLYYSYANN